ncbi:MAG TPA: carbohydrate ABC transporter permease [Acidimicrobiales bacterium]|nr:carbohydrate ABC transporter permease [Acidimicrobiales bacterium]
MIRRVTMRVFWRRHARRFMLPAGGLVITGLMLLPIYFTAETSFEPTSALQALSQSLVPSHFIFSNYRVAFDVEHGSIITSLLIALGAVVLSIGVALPASYGLTKLGYLQSRAIVSVAIMVLLVTQMVPGISLTLAFYKLFLHFHLLNSIAGLILADSTTGMPFATLVLRAYMGSIPVELSDAAYVDGASEWRTFRSVVAPLAVPAIITAGLFVFLFAWGDFLYAYTLTAGGNVTPLTKGLLSFFANNTVNWGPVLATVVLAAVPSGLILSFGQRYVMGGLRAGALKG